MDQLQRVSHGLGENVQIWRVDLDAYAGAVALSGLDASEYVRAGRIPERRAAERFLASHHALRRVLAAALHRSPGELVIRADAFGKPGLGPEHSLQFNLSHSANESLIGLSRDRPIGVDVEVVRPVVDADVLVAEHFTADERVEWRRTPASRRDQTFLTCWTRKEACGKAVRVGLSLPPASLAVGCGTGDRPVAIPLGRPCCDLTLCSLDLPHGCVGAVAIVTSITSTPLSGSFGYSSGTTTSMGPSAVLR